MNGTLALYFLSGHDSPPELIHFLFLEREATLIRLMTPEGESAQNRSLHGSPE
jgi:hypothetical protein